MSVNSVAGVKQFPMSKLPPINELLKTSVGLLRPVTLNNTSTGNVTSNNTSGVPQQMFRYPYGMPPLAQFPVPQPAAFRPQNNVCSRDLPSCVIVVQEYPQSTTNSVHFVQPGSQSISPILSPLQNCEEKVVFEEKPFLPQPPPPVKKKPRQQRKEKDIKDSSNLNSGKRSASPSSSPIEGGSLPKQKRPRKTRVDSSISSTLKAGELENVREKLAKETRQREVERAQSEAIISQLRQEISVLNKRLEAAETVIFGLQKKNADLLLAVKTVQQDFIVESVLDQTMTNPSPPMAEVASDVDEKSEDGGFKLLCPNCSDYSTTVLRNLLAHLSRKHHCKWDNTHLNCKRGTVAKCTACQETAKDLLQLAVHFVREHFHSSKPSQFSDQFSCQILGCAFLSGIQWELLQHVASAHLKDASEKVPVDSVSVVSTSNSSSSSSSSAGNCGNLLCICKHCPYRTERYTDMRKHALRRHGDENAFERREATEADPEITLACGVCPSRFFRPGDLKRHRARYNHFLDVKQEPDFESCSLPALLEEQSTTTTIVPLRFFAPKLNFAARIHAKLRRRFLLMKRRKQAFDLEKQQFVSNFPVDEVEDMFNRAPTSPDLALLISNSDIKTLCDFPSDVEKLLGD